MRQGHRKVVRQIAQQTQQLLKEMQTAGITTVPAGSSRTPKTRSKVQCLEPIRQKALSCRSCPLHKTRNTVVFGEGSLSAPIVFVGEGPGREEDLQGRPFVGAAGNLLTKIIQAMGFERRQVYIANTVKCRPPMNRPPEPEELSACRGYLEAQLNTIRPRIICAMGRTAANALLETQAPMSALRGRELVWGKIPLVITFHPAYLLRNPSAKKDVWEDMQGILKRLGRKTPQSQRRSRDALGIR